MAEEHPDVKVVYDHLCSRANYWWSVAKVADDLDWEQERVRVAVDALGDRRWPTLIYNHRDMSQFRAVDSTDLP